MARARTYTDSRLPNGALTGTQSKPSTAHWASTSTTPQPGRSNHRRDNAVLHQRRLDHHLRQALQ